MSEPDPRLTALAAFNPGSVSFAHATPARLAALSAASLAAGDDFAYWTAAYHRAYRLPPVECYVSVLWSAVRHRLHELERDGFIPAGWTSGREPALDSQVAHVAREAAVEVKGLEGHSMAKLARLAGTRGRVYADSIWFKPDPGAFDYFVESQGPTQPVGAGHRGARRVEALPREGVGPFSYGRRSGDHLP